MPYSIKDAVMFCQEMNGELLRENESQSVPDIGYLGRLRKDEQIFDASIAKIVVKSNQYMEAA